jgi:hypothetical protein
MNPIACIGTANGIEVNAFYSTMFRDGEKIERPCVEIRGAVGIQMHLSKVEGLIELLQEAIEYWREEELCQRKNKG